MTSSNLRELLDEATLEIPPSVAQPPLSAIHDRVKRLRAGSTTAGAAAVAVLALAVAIPFLRDKAPHAPAAPPSIAWEFGFADGANLTVYVTKLPKCTYLNDPAAVATRDGDSYTISIIGEMDTSGCVGPDAQGVSRSELAQATVTLDSPVPVHSIKDAASGQIRPIYARSELPAGFTEGQGRGSSWGAETRGGAAAEFSGSFQFQKSASPPFEITRVTFRGRGLALTPPAFTDGEQVTFGSTKGWLAPISEGSSYRFVWHKPRGDAWITYELTWGFDFAPRSVSRADFVGLLNKLDWP